MKGKIQLTTFAEKSNACTVLGVQKELKEMTVSVISTAYRKN